MASEPKVVNIEDIPERTLQLNPHLRELISILETMDRESDRGKILVTCNLIDDMLKRILLGFMVECKQANNIVDGFNAPLGTFSTRITACFAFGLITPNEHAEVDTLRKIRNKFAHEIHVSPDDMNIRDMSGNLKFWNPKKDGSDSTPIEKFVSSAYAIILCLGYKIFNVGADHRRKQLENVVLVGE